MCLLLYCELRLSQRKITKRPKRLRGVGLRFSDLFEFFRAVTGAPETEEVKGRWRDTGSLS